MDFRELQESMMRTAKFDLNLHDGLTVSCLGLIGEVGEICDVWKKVSYHGHSLDKNKLLTEASDCLWYCVYLSKVIGFPLDSYLSNEHYTMAKAYTAYEKEGLLSNPARATSYCLQRMAREAGGISLLVEFVIDRGYELRPERIGYILINILVYMEWFCELFDSDIEEIALINIEKLNKRYPFGFRVEDSINRKDK